jgi:ferredoxin
LVAFILGSALLGLGGISPVRGTLPWLAFDPLSIFIRAFAGIWSAFNTFFLWAEMELCSIAFLQPAVAWLDSLLRPSVLPLDVLPARNTGWAVLLLVGLVVLNWAARRFWCRYLCPLGGLLGLFSRFALLRRQVEIEDCTGCKLCSRSCPTGTIDDQRGYISDPAECTMCLECLPACPRGDTTFRWTNPLEGQNSLWPAYDPSRRQVLASMGAGLAAAALVTLDAKVKPVMSPVLRPPGSTEAGLLSRCVRCGICVRTCPTAALQPAIFESGIEGLWTPMLLPRLGYCDYSCHACGLACPEGAIPSLTLEEKRIQVIGVAEIDQDRCLPWSNQAPCIVCEEMCPLPEKAVWLEEQEIIQDGNPNTYQRPHVDRDRCIGCGICEYKCPVEGDAAIQVRRI